jgi:hypothetical protein
MNLFFELVKKGCFLTVLFPILFSCNSENGSISDGFYRVFENIDSIEVALPDEYLEITRWTTYNDGITSVLVEYGLANNGDLIIHQIDFSSGGYGKPLTIPREGPNGFNSFDVSAVFKSKDSLFIFPAGKDKFFLYNDLGEKISEYLYNSLTNYQYYRDGWFSSAFFNENNILMPTVDNTRDDSFDYFSREFPFQLFNLESSSFTKSFSYPEFVNGKYVPSNFIGASIAPIDSNSFLVNYNFSDSIYIYNLKLDTKQSLYMGAKNIGSPTFLSNYPDKFQAREYLIKEIDYEVAFFQNGKVYRLVSHLLEKEYKNINSFEILKNNLRAVTLIELDFKKNELKFYKMPIAKYFLFTNNSLIVGGVSLREDDGILLRKFYIYPLN